MVLAIIASGQISILAIIPSRKNSLREIITSRQIYFFIQFFTQDKIDKSHFLMLIIQLPNVLCDHKQSFISVTSSIASALIKHLKLYTIVLKTTIL